MAILVSCGSQGQQLTDTSEADASANETKVAEVSEYTDPGVDYGGKKITIASLNYDGGYVILNYHVALDEENSDIINDAIVKRNRTVEEMLNIDIDIFPLNKDDRGNTIKLQTQILAGDAAFDFALQSVSGLAAMFTTDGMLVDLGTIPTLDLSHSWWNQQANTEYTLYGKQLAALGDLSLFNLGAPIVTFFAKEMITDNKLENPYEIVYSGKWTLDKMIEMASSVARDLNGDQVIDDTDRYGFAGEQGSLSMMMMCAGVRYSESDKDGNISLALNTEKTADIVEKLVTFFNNREVSIIYGMTREKYSSSFLDLFIPKMMQNNLLFYENQLLVALDLRAMNSDFGIIPCPKYDESQEEYNSFPNGAFSDLLVFPATNTELEILGNVLDAMGYYASEYITTAYIDTTVLNKSLRDEDSAKMVELVLDNMTFDIGYIFNWGSMRSNLSSMVKNNNTAFASSYASNEAKIKEALASTIEMLKG